MLALESLECLREKIRRQGAQLAIAHRTIGQLRAQLRVNEHKLRYQRERINDLQRSLAKWKGGAP